MVLPAVRTPEIAEIHGDSAIRAAVEASPASVITLRLRLGQLDGWRIQGESLTVRQAPDIGTFLTFELTLPPTFCQSA